MGDAAFCAMSGHLPRTLDFFIFYFLRQAIMVYIQLYVCWSGELGKDYIVQLYVKFTASCKVTFTCFRTVILVFALTSIMLLWLILFKLIEPLRICYMPWSFSWLFPNI